MVDEAVVSLLLVRRGIRPGCCCMSVALFGGTVGAVAAAGDLRFLSG